VHFGEAVSADLRAPGLEGTYHHSSSLLLRAILEAEDENGQPLDPPMPTWKGRLSPAEALDIIAYLKTLHS
jgi:mono/diheme cytochrome c family protein